MCDVCEREIERKIEIESEYRVSVFLNFYVLYWFIILFDLLYYLPIKAARPHEGFQINQSINLL